MNLFEVFADSFRKLEIQYLNFYGNLDYFSTLFLLQFTCNPFII